MNFYKNAEGYSDPTAGAALSHIAKQEHNYERAHRKSKHRPQSQHKTECAELGDPYKALANAVILQAVEDYRMARRYLHRHPHTPKLDEIVAEQKKQQEERQKKGNPPKTREMRLLERILRNEDTVTEVERFFHSEYFMLLSNVDGPGLLARLKKEAVE